MFFIRLNIDYVSLKSRSLPVRWSRESAMFVVLTLFMRVCSYNRILVHLRGCVVGNIKNVKKSMN